MQQKTIKTPKLNLNKHIGKVVFIVEGEKREQTLLKRIFVDVLHYSLVSVKKNEEPIELFRNNEDVNSQIFVVTSINSNIKSIKTGQDYLDVVYRKLYEDYNLDISNAATYYLFDRDPQSNNNVKLIYELISELKNSRDNGVESNGLLLLSYPNIESYIISCFEDETNLIEIRHPETTKKYISKARYMQENIGNSEIIHAAIEMLLGLQRLVQINLETYMLDNFKDVNNKMLTIRQFVNNMDNMLKDEYYKKLDQENINKKVAFVEQQIQEQKRVVQFIENQIATLENEGLQIVRDLTEIPAYYFQQESILQMLFFYVNKRADNVKELINLYEQTVFQEELLGSLNSISVSIDRLANVIDNNFRRLGLQLGVINESINANTQQLVLNKSKLAQIQDEASRNYIQTVEHINNVEKIITEQFDSGLTVSIKS